MKLITGTLPALLLLLACQAGMVSAETPVPRIAVVGEGSVQVAPDMALLTLTVTREADTARAALDANSAAMAQVLAAMRKEGIAERDLQTSGFSIQPRYTQPPRKPSGEREAPRIVGYTVRNSLGVKVRDLDLVGAIIDRSVSLGVNEGGNILFTNDDPAAEIAKARAAAVADARARASTIAEAAGVELGDILEISEQSRVVRPMPMMQAEVAMARSADAVPLAAGENTYRVHLNLSYAIKH